MVAASMMSTRDAFASDTKELQVTQFESLRKYVQVGNNRLAYIDRGRGPVALFLHGFPLNGYQWRGVIPLLSHYRRCIAPDFMALGYSEIAESQELSPESQCVMLGSFLDRLRIKSVDIVANDSGGEIAQLFVAKNAARVRTLLITNCDVDTNSPPPSFKPILAAAQAGTLPGVFERLLADKDLARSSKGLGAFYSHPDALSDQLIEYYLSPLVSSPLRKAQLNQYTKSFAVNPLVEIRPLLQQCRVPVRIVWGAADTTFAAAWGDWLDKNLPNSKGVRYVENAKLFFPEEMPHLIAEEARTLWKA
jgi:pimeloyl-ACP methyl ester carboxylesterase